MFVGLLANNKYKMLTTSFNPDFSSKDYENNVFQEDLNNETFQPFLSDPNAQNHQNNAQNNAQETQESTPQPEAQVIAENGESISLLISTFLDTLSASQDVQVIKRRADVKEFNFDLFQGTISSCVFCFTCRTCFVFCVYFAVAFARCVCC